MFVKENRKFRILSALLALGMVLTAVDVPAFAVTAGAAEDAAVQAVEEPAAQTTTDQAADTEEEQPAVAAEDPQTEIPDVSTEDTGEATGEVSSEDASFDIQKLRTLYADGKLTASGSDELKIQDSEKNGGILVSGTSEQLATETFTFADTFDFGSGIVGRWTMDAMAAKGQNLTVSLYLDDDTEPIAQVKLAKQKKAKKWYTKAQSVSVYDKKITGQHTVSFRVTSDKEEDNVQLLLRSMTLAKSTVPVIYFNIDETQGTVDAMNHDPDHDTECYGSMTVEVPDGYNCEYANDKGKTDNVKTETYDLEYIRGRGNSTWGTGKNPYKIKLDKKANLFNMGKNKHWVLLADYYDASHLRNKATYRLAAQLGMEFTPQCVFVDVVMNGEYYGSYLLSEQVRVGENRVDIDDLADNEDSMHTSSGEALTGGYLLAMSPYDNDTGATFQTKRGNEYLIESPDFEDYPEDAADAQAAQIKYISDYVQATENAIYASNGTYKETHYSDYMDIASAIDYYWVQEISMNGDAFASTSTYLYKKRNGKLFWGPLWDFDYVAWGNNEYGKEDMNYQGWSQRESTWFEKLLRRKEFADQLIARWPTIHEKLVELSKDGGILDQYAEQIAYSQKYNKELVGNNYEEEYQDKTFADDVAQLKMWIQLRTEWIDSHMSSLKVKQCTVTFQRGSRVVAIQTTTKGDPIAKFPKQPTRKGYYFKGWFTKNGVEFSKGDSVQKNMTVYAKWISKKNVKPVTQITLGYDRYTMMYNADSEESFRLPYRLGGGSGLKNGLVWKSSNTKVATVSKSGYITPCGVGKTTITLSTKNGKVSDSCKLTVLDSEKDDYISMSDFTLSRSKVTVEKNKKTIVSARTQPKNCMDPGLDWISSDPSVATVDQFGSKAVIKGRKKGTAIILCLGDGEDGQIVRTCKVRVK